MNIKLSREFSVADELSILPIAQQIIGLGTLIDAIVNIWKEHQKIQKSEDQLKRKSDSTIYKLKTNIHNRRNHDSLTKIKEYEQDILLGLIRMTPLVGTVYSFHKWLKQLKS